MASRHQVDHLHYRILDVSALKEAAKRWCPETASRVPRKKLAHRARDDILESIQHADFFKTAIFEAATGTRG